VILDQPAEQRTRDDSRLGSRIARKHLPAFLAFAVREQRAVEVDQPRATALADVHSLDRPPHRDEVDARRDNSDLLSGNYHGLGEHLHVAEQRL
jgi:hypothetical protein